MTAPNPKLKSGRTKRIDFDEFDWNRYISEEALVEAIPSVYGCDPRDSKQYKLLQKVLHENYEKRQGSVETKGDIMDK